MDIVVVGHVDHGKSTITGRMLADTNSLPKGKLEQVKEMCEKNSKPFEYAFLLDALKDEQSQGITIDSSRVFFKTQKRNYTIIDAPGHIEFLKNMVTGAARAEAAVLVIDAKEGVKENSRRHGLLLSFLGVKQVAVVVNKMDLNNYSKVEFEKIQKEYTDFLKNIDIKPMWFIPVAGIHGENVATRSVKMPWYTGPTIIEALDEFVSNQSLSERPFRMPVQDVYKFTKGGDDRRIVAGTIDTGVLNVGDEVIFYPSGKKSFVKTIEVFSAPPAQEARSGAATGFTLTEQIYIARGEIAALTNESAPRVSNYISVNIFWLGKQPMRVQQTYLLKLGTAKLKAELLKVTRSMDSSNLSTHEKREEIAKNCVAECILKLESPLAFDLASEFPTTGRFVIVDGYDIAGGGLVNKAVDENEIHSNYQIEVESESDSTEFRKVTTRARTERYSQRATLVVVTGKNQNQLVQIGKRLESELFWAGRFVQFTDLKSGKELQDWSKVARGLLDAGLIVVAAAEDFNKNDYEIIKNSVSENRIEVVWVKEPGASEISSQTDKKEDHFYLNGVRIASENDKDTVEKIYSALQEKKIIFRF